MPLGPRRESPVALPALPPLYLLRTRSTPRSRRLRPPPRPARRRFRRELRLYLLRTRSRPILRRLRRLLPRLPTRKPKPAKAALSVKRESSERHTYSKGRLQREAAPARADLLLAVFVFVADDGHGEAASSARQGINPAAHGRLQPPGQGAPPTFGGAPLGALRSAAPPLRRQSRPPPDLPAPAVRRRGDTGSGWSRCRSSLPAPGTRARRAWSRWRLR